MAISSSISRLTAYFARHGFWATVHRAVIAGKRAVFSNRMVLLYCDLSAQSSPAADLPKSLTVERYRTQTEVSLSDLEQISSFWNPLLSKRNIKKRFEQGGSLWLIKSEDRLAGYGWTLQGHTIEPHYFRLGPDDVHLFDFQVFPQYRGRGMNPQLVGYILRSLAVECRGRAFIEAAEWNRPQLASLRNTPFRRLGLARKFTVLRRTIVCWDDNEAVEQQRTGDVTNAPAPAASGHDPNRGLASLKH
jgi:ribosomal protein S18 acetylase RimI-like enzyme